MRELTRRAAEGRWQPSGNVGSPGLRPPSSSIGPSMVVPNRVTWTKQRVANSLPTPLAVRTASWTQRVASGDLTLDSAIASCPPRGNPRMSITGRASDRPAGPPGPPSRPPTGAQSASPNPCPAGRAAAAATTLSPCPGEQTRRTRPPQGRGAPSPDCAGTWQRLRLPFRACASPSTAAARFATVSLTRCRAAGSAGALALARGPLQRGSLRDRGPAPGSRRPSPAPRAATRSG